MTNTEPQPPTFANGTRVARIDDGSTGTVAKTELVGAIEVVSVRYDQGDEHGNRAGDVLQGDAAAFRPLDEQVTEPAASLDDLRTQLARARDEFDRAATAVADLEDAIAAAEADEQANRAPSWTFDLREHEVTSQAPQVPSEHVERDEFAIDMSKMAVTATAAVLAIRARVATRAAQAQEHWRRVQHGKRSEHWAGAREVAAEMGTLLGEVDATIAERMS